MMVRNFGISQKDIGYLMENNISGIEFSQSLFNKILEKKTTRVRLESVCEFRFRRFPGLF